MSGFGEYIDIENALHAFKYNDLFIASVGLFDAMNFPVISSIEAKNIDANKFVFSVAEKRLNFSRSEMEVLQHVESISYLFKICESNLNIKNLKLYKQKETSINSIVFIAVELKSSLDSKIIDAYSLTQILNKCFYDPVIILFRYNDQIMFGSQAFKNRKNVNVYLSEWYSTDDSDIVVLDKFVGLCFENYSINSFRDLFNDILWAFSREYYIYPDSPEYVKYGLYLNEYMDDIPYFDDIYSIISYREKSMEQLEQKRIFYKDLYGNDYIVEVEKLEMFFDDDESSIEESFDLFIFENKPENDNREEEGEYYDTQGNEETEDIDDLYFEDPIELLKLIEGRSE